MGREVIFDNEDMEVGEIRRISCIRTDKIYTLSKDIIVKKFGQIKVDKVREVRSDLLNIISDEK